MRCIGPYSASALFAKGLAWEYGNDAGSRLPGDGGPVADPMPENVGSTALVANPGGTMLQFSAMLDGVEPAMLWRRLGGLTVYVVMITLVVITLVVGSTLPDVPWSPAEDESGSDEEEEEVIHGSQ